MTLARPRAHRPFPAVRQRFPFDLEAKPLARVETKRLGNVRSRPANLVAEMVEKKSLALSGASADGSRSLLAFRNRVAPANSIDESTITTLVAQKIRIIF
jgi:hypothetical protein